jgi:hypothetical protein
MNGENGMNYVLFINYPQIGMQILSFFGLGNAMLARNGSSEFGSVLYDKNGDVVF